MPCSSCCCPAFTPKRQQTVSPFGFEAYNRPTAVTVSVTVPDRDDSYTIINTQPCSSQQGGSVVTGSYGILLQRPSSGTYSLTQWVFPNIWRYFGEKIYIQVDLSDEVSLYASGEPNLPGSCAPYSQVQVWFSYTRRLNRQAPFNPSGVQPVTLSELQQTGGTYNNRLILTKYCRKYVPQNGSTCESRENHTIVSQLISNRDWPLPGTAGGGTASVEGLPIGELPQQYQNFPISSSLPYLGTFALWDESNYVCPNNGTTLHSKSRTGEQETTQATIVVNSVTATLPDGSTQGIFDI